MDARTPKAMKDAASAAKGRAPRLGLIEFIRKVREDQLLIVTPELFGEELVYSRILFLHSFLINKPEYIEHVLLANHANYRKSHFSRNLLGPLLGNGLLTSEGELWRRQRRIAAPAFHARRTAEFVATMGSCSEAMLTRWAARGGSFDVAAEMTALTLDIIARTMFSTEVAGDIDAIRQLTDVVVKLRPSLLDLFGFPQWIPRLQPKPYRASKAATAARDAETGQGMSERQLRDEILTIFLAGHETTANALSWTWYLLAQNPQAEARLHEELDRVLDGRTPRFTDLAELKWTRMVIEEAMRLYPPAHTIARAAIGEDRIGGVRVPPGASISISMYVTHRNPNLWPAPERFDPERFAPAAVAGRHRFAYLPFGGGPRICIGNGFAMAEAQVILATVAQRYRLRLARNHAVEPIGLITLRPKHGLWVTLEPRRPGGTRTGSTGADEPL